MTLSTRPKSVALLGMGPSLRSYMDDSFRKKNLQHFDEVWGVNTVHRIFKCDKIWAMDDLKYGIGHNYPDWASELKLESIPIITSTAYDEFPTSVAYPLEEVINKFKGDDFFSNTIAYAIAYAALIEVETLCCCGIDFYYPEAKIVESGLGCVSYWLGIAKMCGVKYQVPNTSTLLDAHLTQFDTDEKNQIISQRRLRYGYDYNPNDAKRKVKNGSGDPNLQAIADKSHKADIVTLNEVEMK